MDAEVTIIHREDKRRIEVVISIPFENYARSLWPNEEIREYAGKGLDAALEMYAANRR